MNRLDRERERFHQKIRDAFLVLATREPDRIRVVDARIGRAEVSEAILRHVTAALGGR
jgi:dTMP kinase